MPYQFCPNFNANWLAGVYSVVYISSQWDKVGNMANLLIGEYEHTLDEKGVSRFRKYSGRDGEKVVMTRGLDNCPFTRIHARRGTRRPEASVAFDGQP